VSRPRQWSLVRARAAGLLSAVIVAAGILFVRPAVAAEHSFVIGTAPVAGVYFPAGGAICRLFNAKRAEEDPRCLVESTSGSSENLKRLAAGELDFVLLQSDWQYHAYLGTGGLGSDPPFTDLRAIFSLHAQPLTIVAGRESGITVLADLKGKRVNFGRIGTAARTAAEVLIQSLGWSDQDFAEVMDLDIDQQVEALCAGLIDAFILPSSHPNGVIAAATEGCLARLVSVEGEAVDRLLENWPYFAPAVIPGGTYRGNPEDVRSFGVRATFVTRADQPTELVYLLVESVFSQLEDLKKQHPAFAQLSREAMVALANTAPLHEGALIYYRERGWK